MEDTWYEKPPQKGNAGNLLIPSRRKANFERTPRATRCTGRAQTSTTILCPDGLLLSTSLAFMRTVRVRRDVSVQVPKIEKI